MKEQTKLDEHFFREAECCGTCKSGKPRGSWKDTILDCMEDRNFDISDDYRGVCIYMRCNLYEKRK
jgi:hypothetical protein